MPKPELIHISRLTWQEAIKLQEDGVNHQDIYELRRHLIGALKVCDKILYGNGNATIPVDKK